ncbi:MAG: hypothetical protein HY904_09910 [Deltaproteobacteria bacterium]|nr:hypothetical protein [Deltaproteobacteria bacterium]
MVDPEVVPSDFPPVVASGAQPVFAREPPTDVLLQSGRVWFEYPVFQDCPRDADVPSADAGEVGLLLGCWVSRVSIEGNRVTIRLAEGMPPGTGTLHIHIPTQPLQVTRCEGAERCTFQRYDSAAGAWSLTITSAP